MANTTQDVANLDRTTVRPRIWLRPCKDAVTGSLPKWRVLQAARYGLGKQDGHFHVQRSPKVLYGAGDPTFAALEDRAAAAFLWRMIPKTVRRGS
jgi:hypothetical protein